MHSLRLAPIWLAMLLWGCSNQLPTPPDPATDAGADLPPSQQPFTLQISPATAPEIFSTGTPVTVKFKALQVITATQQQIDVTDVTNWEITPQPGQMLPLGMISQGTFTSGASAGQGQVVAQYLGQTAMVPISLHLALTDLSTANDQSNPPASSPSRFPSGQTTTAKAPTLLYPPSGAVLPQNLGGLEVQWSPKGGTDLYQVEITGKWLDLLIYTTSTKGRLTLSTQEYELLADAGLYGPVTVQVSGGNQSGASTFGQSTVAQLLVTPELTAGLYYFAVRGSTQAAATTPQGIYRYNWLANPGTLAQPYVTDKNTEPGVCAGCHSLSQDGLWLAYGTSPGAPPVWPPTTSTPQPGGVIDVNGSRVPTLANDPKWVTSAINSTGNLVLASANNQLSFVSADVGSQVSTLPIGAAAGTTASQPSISADGQQVVFVRGTLTGGTNEVLNLQSGALMLLQAQAGDFTTPPTTLVSTTGNNYFPSFIPTTSADGQWILFVYAQSGPAYDNPAAALWAVRSDGKVGPLPLTNANAAIVQNTAVGTSLTNSWPRASGLPVQVNGRTLYYFTFSSRREYGVEITRTGTAKATGSTVVLGTGASPTTEAGWSDQVWLSTFDPALANQGLDPSSAAIWLPYQNPLSSNHTATWTPTITGGNLP